MAIFNNNTNLYTITGFDTKFSWQVGFQKYNLSNQDLQFRATIRPLTNDETYNRIPNDTVLYEETGIVINNADHLGEYTFPLSTNSALAGGPYRNYQLVIEAHDSQGNTSAGNKVGTSSETNWTAYPFGYDIIGVSNPRQTGIELSNNFPTTNVDVGGIRYTLITGASDSKYKISGTAGLIGAGTFSGSGVFTGNYATTNFNFTQTGLSSIQNFTGLSLFTGFGSFYLGNTFLGSNMVISGTSKFTGVNYFIDTGDICPSRTDDYSTQGFMNGDGGITIRFIDGTFNSDLKGGYLYVSTGRFPKLDAAINVGNYGATVQKTRFSFDPIYQIISAPAGAFKFRGANYVYASVSFYDALDELALNNDPNLDISTGLYISNNAILYNDVAVGSMTVGGVGTYYSFSTTEPNTSSLINLNPVDLNNTIISSFPETYARLGTNWAIAATTSLDGTTVIYYISAPISTLSGSAGGGGGGAVSDGGNSLGVVTYTPPAQSFVSSLSINLSVSGTATKFNYNYRDELNQLSPGSYHTNNSTGRTTTITNSKRVWARPLNATEVGAWQYQDYIKL